LSCCCGRHAGAARRLARPLIFFALYY
jgi:hypothetical protein